MIDTETAGQNNATAQGTENATPQTSAAATPATTNANVSTGSNAAAPAPAAEEWKPDFNKLKVMDKEFDWDPDVKKVVTKDNYERIKEMHNKAYGLEFVKERLAQTKEEMKKYKEIEAKHKQMNESIEYLNSYLNKGDLHSFFSALKIPEQQVLKYALERANYYDMPAEQKQVYDRQLQERQQLSVYEQQNAQLNEQVQNLAVRQREYDLDMYLNRNEVSSIAKAFDEKVGKIGAFREQVIKQGQLAYYQNETDLTPEQAVNDVLNLYKPILGQPAMPMNQVGQMPMGQQTQTEKPVIPNIKSGAHSPAKKVYKSLDDLKKLARTMEG